jgi:hypothetical protein
MQEETSKKEKVKHCPYCDWLHKKTMEYIFSNTDSKKVWKWYCVCETIADYENWKKLCERS